MPLSSMVSSCAECTSKTPTAVHSHHPYFEFALPTELSMYRDGLPATEKWYIALAEQVSTSLPSTVAMFFDPVEYLSIIAVVFSALCGLFGKSVIAYLESEF